MLELFVPVMGNCNAIVSKVVLDNCGKSLRKRFYINVMVRCPQTFVQPSVFKASWLALRSFLLRSHTFKHSTISSGSFYCLSLEKARVSRKPWKPNISTHKVKVPQN